MDEMGDLLAPWQLGYGVRGGSEAAVHAARLYLQSFDTSKALLKLDFRNAFNSIQRDRMLMKVLELAPRLFCFVHSAYSSPSTLFWEDKTIQSAEGVQQGDPLGPLLFCLTIQQLKAQLTSEFQVFYLDDGTLGGSIEDLRHDLQVVEKVGQEIGLQLNEEKTEVICCSQEARESVLSSLPGVLVVENEEATLLGSPIGGVSAISTTLREKVDALKIMGGRLAHLATHDALLLVKHSFALPKLLHCLRTAPCFLLPGLQEYMTIILRPLLVRSPTSTFPMKALAGSRPPSR